MRCKDCKHFLAENPVDPEPGLGHCTRWHRGYHVNASEVGKNEAWVEDDEGWGNQVGPEFGCVLFELKL